MHVVDIKNPPRGRKSRSFIPAKEGSYPGEGVDTAHFTGDILVSNNEICKGQAGFGGMYVYDVTDPERPPGGVDD